MTWFLVLLLPLTSIADQTLQPQRLNWCAALFSTAEPGRPGTHARALNEAHARVAQAREPAGSASHVRALRFARWLGRLSPAMRGVEFSVELKDIKDENQARREIIQLDALAERLRTIEHDATRLKDDTITFAQVHTGEAEIEAFLATVESRAREVDVANTFGLKDPYRRFTRWLGPTVMGSSYGFLTLTMAFATFMEAKLHNFDRLIVDGFLTAFWAAHLQHEVTKLTTYVAGLRWQRARLYYENHFNPERTHGYGARLRSVADVARQGARPLAYASLQFAATNETVDRLLRGVGHSAPATPDAFDPVQRQVLIDFVSYRDDDDQPVLLSVVRFKRPPRRGNQKSPPRRSANPRGPRKWAPGGLAPAGI